MRSILPQKHVSCYPHMLYRLNMQIIIKVCIIFFFKILFLTNYIIFNDQKDIHQPGFLSNDRLLPPRIPDQHKLTKEQWEQKITCWWSEHKGLPREEAMMEYLK